MVLKVRWQRGRHGIVSRPFPVDTVGKAYVNGFRSKKKNHCLVTGRTASPLLVYNGRLRLAMAEIEHAQLGETHGMRAEAV